MCSSRRREKNGEQVRSETQRICRKGRGCVVRRGRGIESGSALQASTEDVYVRRTMAWLSRVVVAFELCPFACCEKTRCVSLAEPCRPRDNEDIFVTVHDILGAVGEEAMLLIKKDDSDPVESRTNTTLVVVPHLIDFADFMDTITLCEKYLEEINLGDQLQLVPFHPNAVFDAPHSHSNNDTVTNARIDPADFTARSPYPTIHLLLESEVDKALKSWRSLGKSTSKDIIDRNKRKLRDLGHELLQKQCVDDILRL